MNLDLILYKSISPRNPGCQSIVGYPHTDIYGRKSTGQIHGHTEATCLLYRNRARSRIQTPEMQCWRPAHKHSMLGHSFFIRSRRRREGAFISLSNKTLFDEVGPSRQQKGYFQLQIDFYFPPCRSCASAPLANGPSLIDVEEETQFWAHCLKHPRLDPAESYEIYKTRCCQNTEWITATGSHLFTT